MSFEQTKGATARRDFDLLQDAGSDAAAFRMFYDRHAEAIFAFLERRTWSTSAEAIDLLAETFAAAWLSRAIVLHSETNLRRTLIEEATNPHRRPPCPSVQRQCDGAG